MRLHRAPLTALLIASLFQSAFAQLISSEHDRGIALYQQGKYQEAVNVLRPAVIQYKDDLTAWHYLGLALENLQQAEEARKAHEQTARLGDALIAQKLSKQDSGDFVVLFGPLVSQLRQAAQSADHYLQLTPKLSKAEIERVRVLAQCLLDFAEVSDANSPDQGLRMVFDKKDVTTRVRILKKPEPMYTDKATEKRITGRVTLRAILCADGKVRAIVPLESLPEGLTENSIRVAQKIKFIPAIKDGKPVSTIVRLEYEFRISG